jgi:hypothetical protein
MEPQHVVTLFVLIWVALTWLQTGFSFAANLEATKWDDGTGKDTTVKPSNWHASQVLDSIAVIGGLAVPIVILWANSKITIGGRTFGVGGTSVAGGSLTSGSVPSITTWM